MSTPPQFDLEHAEVIMEEEERPGSILMGMEFLMRPNRLVQAQAPREPHLGMHLLILPSPFRLRQL